MDRKSRLLHRLTAIGTSMAATEGALALIGLGSVGSETARLDEYSDLDFFAIVGAGYKQRFLHSYVGLCRFQRGEKLAAARFIQGYAVDRVLDLAALVEEERPGFHDPFAQERRFEQCFPETAVHLPQFFQGYENSPASARAILHFLADHFELNPAMKGVIEELCKE